MSFCLAIDIGASSGRHILAQEVNGKMECTEIYRFENGFNNVNGNLEWDIELLTNNVLEGLKKCSELGKIPTTVAIDTWGVDYVLFDAKNKEILPAVAYRDARTANIPEEIDKIIPPSELYAINGIQRQPYNTIYQLYCDAKSGKLEKAEKFLMIPEYLSYRLTGVMKNEYTNASTTALLNAKERNWDFDLINKLGIKPSIFGELNEPGTVIGNLKPDIQEYVGFDTTVIFAPSHDTASAVAACKLEGHSMYISSGTWSLIGAVNEYPVLSDSALQANFTNEGGVNKTFRFLKNIMGMWLFQNIRKNLNKKYTYDEMMYMAQKSTYTKTFNPNDERLLAPENMIEAIKECLEESNIEIGDLLSSVYHTLAKSYSKVVKEIEDITGEKVDSINIVGGGSKDVYLNELTQKYTGKKVFTGPVEATAIGNLKTQFAYLNINVN